MIDQQFLLVLPSNEVNLHYGYHSEWERDFENSISFVVLVDPDNVGLTFSHGREWWSYEVKKLIIYNKQWRQK